MGVVRRNSQGSSNTPMFYLKRSDQIEMYRKGYEMAGLTP